jgi:hypothetical protein
MLLPPALNLTRIGTRPAIAITTGGARDGRDTPGHDGEGTVPRVQSCGVWHHAAGESSNRRRNSRGSARARQHCGLLRAGLTGDAKQSKCLDRASVVISLNLA